MTYRIHLLALAILVAPLTIAVAADTKPAVTKLSGLSATAPAAWQSEKPSNRLRSYQFKLASPEKDLADGELAVFPESTPKWEDKFKEWKETIVPADDVKPEDAAKQSEFKVGENVVHVLDANGTWKYRERPRDPSSKEMLKPEYRVVWLVLVTKDETTHIRLSGPAKVVDKHYADAIAWVKSLK